MPFLIDTYVSMKTRHQNCSLSPLCWELCRLLDTLQRLVAWREKSLDYLLLHWKFWQAGRKVNWRQPISTSFLCLPNKSCTYGLVRKEEALQVGGSFGATCGLLLMTWLPGWNIQPGLYAMCAATAMLGGVFRASISLVVLLVEGTQVCHFYLLLPAILPFSFYPFPIPSLWLSLFIALRIANQIRWLCNHYKITLVL